MSHQPSVIERRIEWTRGFRCATDKAVLKALARWYAYRADGSHVRPTSIDALAAKSGIPKRSVTRALQRLVNGRWLVITARCNRGTSTYQITLDRLASADPDRLTVVERHSGVRVDGCDSSRARVALENGLERHSGVREINSDIENRPDLHKVALPYGSDPVVEEEIRTPTTAVLPRHSGVRDEDVATFLAWWTVTYPLQNRGEQNPVDQGHDGGVVRELLDHYALDRLQAMALLMWHVVADLNPFSDRSWITQTNRGLRVLRRKAMFLDLALHAPEQLTFGPMEEVALSAREVDEAKQILTRSYGGWCPHDPKCEDWRECVREIALARHVS